MITASQLIYDLWQVVTPLVSDDSILDERQLFYWVKTQRALWIRNELNKGMRTIDDNIVQSLGRIELDVVDSIEGNPYTGSAKILKSTVKIPVAIELHYGTAITRVGSLDMKCKPYKFIDYTAVPYAGNGKFNRNEIFAFLKGGYLYVVSNCNNPAMKVLKYVNVRGVFEDPEEVGRFREADGSPCWTYDTAFPVNMWMVNYMKDAIIKADLRPFLQPILDETNNANPKSEMFNEKKQE